MLVLGRETRAPVDAVYGTNSSAVVQTTYDEFVQDVRDRMNSAYEIVREHIGHAAERNKRYYDVRVRPMKYGVGDWVLYFNPRGYQGLQKKWQRKYIGPFCVVKLLGPVNVLIQRSKRAKSFVVHIDKIKPYYGEVPSTWLQPSNESDQDQDNCQRTDDQSIPPATELQPHVNATPSDCPNDLCNCEETRQYPPVNTMPLDRVHVDLQADVLTFDENQEFRRNRPRREIRLPQRYL